MATDFSSGSDVALDYALSVVRRYDAHLYVAHVVLPDILQPTPLGIPKGEMDAFLRHAERQMCQLLVSGRLRGVPHQVLLGHGALWAVLSEMIREHEIDLVVVGTHGRTGVRKLVLGSGAEEIFRLAPCPVMTVGPQVPSQVPAEITVRRILSATDFTVASERAAAYAFSLAQEFQARITLLHVVENAGAASAHEQEALREAVLRQLRRFVPPEAEFWCELEFAVKFGAASDGILEAARERQADLIVMGVSKVGSFPGHLPPATAYKVACQAHCPVLTARA